MSHFLSFIFSLFISSHVAILMPTSLIFLPQEEFFQSSIACYTPIHYICPLYTLSSQIHLEYLRSIQLHSHRQLYCLIGLSIKKVHLVEKISKHIILLLTCSLRSSIDLLDIARGKDLLMPFHVFWLPFYSGWHASPQSFCGREEEIFFVFKPITGPVVLLPFIT